MRNEKSRKVIREHITSYYESYATLLKEIKAAALPNQSVPEYCEKFVRDGNFCVSYQQAECVLVDAFPGIEVNQNNGWEKYVEVMATELLDIVYYTKKVVYALESGLTGNIYFNREYREISCDYRIEYLEDKYTMFLDVDYAFQKNNEIKYIPDDIDISFNHFITPSELTETLFDLEFISDILVNLLELIKEKSLKMLERLEDHCSDSELETMFDKILEEVLL